MLTETAIRARLAGHFPGEQERRLAEVFNSIRADITAIDAALDALAAKLNADATVTDTDYAGVTITSTGI